MIISCFLQNFVNKDNSYIIIYKKIIKVIKGSIILTIKYIIYIIFIKYRKNNQMNLISFNGAALKYTPTILNRCIYKYKKKLQNNKKITSYYYINITNHLHINL